MSRKAYPSDVSDEEWEFVASYLTLMKEDAPQRVNPLRELFNALRWFVRAGCPWRMLPNDLPPWTAVEQQTKRWMRAGCLEVMAHDLRALRSGKFLRHFKEIRQLLTGDLAVGTDVSRRSASQSNQRL